MAVFLVQRNFFHLSSLAMIDCRGNATAIALVVFLLCITGCQSNSAPTPGPSEKGHASSNADSSSSSDATAQTPTAQMPSDDTKEESFPAVSYGIVLREASPEGKALDKLEVTDAKGQTTCELPPDKLKDLGDCTSGDLAPLTQKDLLAGSPALVPLSFQRMPQRDLPAGESLIELHAASYPPVKLQLDKALKGKKPIDVKGIQAYVLDFALVDNAGKPQLRGTVLLALTSQLTTDQNQPLGGTPSVPLPETTPAAPFDFTKLSEMPVASTSPPPDRFAFPDNQPVPDANELAKRLGSFERGIKRIAGNSTELEEFFSPGPSGYGTDDSSGQFYAIASGAVQTNSFLKEIVTFNTTVFPGALLNGKKLTAPTNTSLSVEVQSFGPKSRHSLTYATDVGVNLGNLGFDPDDQNEYNAKVLNTIRRSNVASPGNFDLTFTAFNSEQHLKSKLGVQAEGFGFSGQFDSTKMAENFESAVVVLMRQRMFDVSITNPPHPFHNWFSRQEYHDDDGRKFQQCCPMLYVDRVHYGKLAMLVVVGKGSATEVATAVKAAYSGFGVSVAGQYSEEQKAKANSLRASLFVHGGNPEIARDIRSRLDQPGTEGRQADSQISGTLSQVLPAVLAYFAPESNVSSAQPIGFTARYLYDNGQAVCIAATHSQMCIVTPLKINYWVLLDTLHLDDRGTGGFLFIQPPGEWIVAFKRQNSSWSQAKQTNCMRLYEGDQRLDRQWEFSSSSGADVLEFIFGESDHSNDDEPINDSNVTSRWDGYVSSGVREKPLNFTEFIASGDPIDGNGRPMTDREAAPYRQQGYTTEGLRGNTLTWAVRVQVPEAMKQSEIRKQAESMKKAVEQEVPNAALPDPK